MHKLNDLIAFKEEEVYQLAKKKEECDRKTRTMLKDHDKNKTEVEHEIKIKQIHIKYKKDEIRESNMRLKELKRHNKNIKMPRK